MTSSNAMYIPNLYLNVAAHGVLLQEEKSLGTAWLGCNVWLEEFEARTTDWRLVRVIGGLALRRGATQLVGETLVNALHGARLDAGLRARWAKEHDKITDEVLAAIADPAPPAGEAASMSPAAKNTGLRFNSGKLSFSLIPREVRIELARVYSIGAIKYTRDNWLGGMEWSTMMDCAERHYEKWCAGLTVDEDTGCHHLALAIWNLAGLLVYQLRGIGTDDRTRVPLDENFNYTSGPAAALDLGLSPEEIKALEERYRALRTAAGPAGKSGAP